jgi:hypothetical protein
MWTGGACGELGKKRTSFFATHFAKAMRVRKASKDRLNFERQTSIRRRLSAMAGQDVEVKKEEKSEKSGEVGDHRKVEDWGHVSGWDGLGKEKDGEVPSEQ